METTTLNLKDRLEKCHSLVHEISYDIDNENTIEAKDKLKTLDLLLHEGI